MRLDCPIGGCGKRFDVSEVDPDSTLSDVWKHLGRRHRVYGTDRNGLLAQVEVVRPEFPGQVRDDV